ncbi:uncharacterized protein [Amphiura filiformis]|uniref:uncharacterized protein n=1 Tax=Amphiura filiformis TaxID=82378 RepID=UPI003B22010B
MHRIKFLNFPSILAKSCRVSHESFLGDVLRQRKYFIAYKPEINTPCDGVAIRRAFNVPLPMKSSWLATAAIFSLLDRNIKETQEDTIARYCKDVLEYIRRNNPEEYAKLNEDPEKKEKFMQAVKAAVTKNIQNKNLTSTEFKSPLTKVAKLLAKVRLIDSCKAWNHMHDTPTQENMTISEEEVKFILEEKAVISSFKETREDIIERYCDDVLDYICRNNPEEYAKLNEDPEKKEQFMETVTELIQKMNLTSTDFNIPNLLAKVRLINSCKALHHMYSSTQENITKSSEQAVDSIHKHEDFIVSSKIMIERTCDLALEFICIDAPPEYVEKLNGDSEKKEQLIQAAMATVTEYMSLTEEFSEGPVTDIAERLMKHLPKDRIEMIQAGLTIPTVQLEVTRGSCIVEDSAGNPLMTRPLNSPNNIDWAIMFHYADILVETVLLLMSVAGISIRVDPSKIRKVLEELTSQTKHNSILLTALDELIKGWNKATEIGGRWVNLEKGKQIVQLLEPICDIADFVWTIICLLYEETDWFEKVLAVVQLTTMIYVAVATGGVVLIAEVALAVSDAITFAKKFTNVNEMKKLQHED